MDSVPNVVDRLWSLSQHGAVENRVPGALGIGLRTSQGVTLPALTAWSLVDRKIRGSV